MRIVLALFIALLAVGATAQETETLGLFFSDTEFTPEYTNWDNTFAPFNMYLVLLGCTVDYIGAYEVGLEFSDPSVFVLATTGPNGWTNFGSPLNHLVGFQTPIPCDPDGVILCTFNLLYSGTDVVCINLIPAVPSSLGDVPAIADGENPDILMPCQIYNAPGCTATINDVVAAEGQSLTHIKGLFR